MSYAPVTAPSPAASGSTPSPQGKDTLDPLKSNSPAPKQNGEGMSVNVDSKDQSPRGGRSSKSGGGTEKRSGSQEKKEVKKPTERTMRAFQVKTHAHPSKISVSPDIPIPMPNKADDVLIEVYAAGLNFFDILQSQGLYQNQPPLPFILGTEFSGKVVGFGKGLEGERPKGCGYDIGDRVFGAAQGAFAPYLVTDWRTCMKIPEDVAGGKGGLDWERAVGMFITYPTSYTALHTRAHSLPEEYILIHAAAGGVGLAACQIAKSIGMKVIATVGGGVDSEKGKVARDVGGAEWVVDYRGKEWQKEVMKITNGKGVDVVYDPVGLLVPSLKVCAWNARLLVVGFAAGTIEKIPANLVLLKNVSIVGVHWGGYLSKQPEHAPSVLRSLFDLLKEGSIKPAIYSTIYQGPESVAQGLADLEGRKTWGKAVVRIRGDDGVVVKGMREGVVGSVGAGGGKEKEKAKL